MENSKKSLHRCTYEGCTSVFNRPYRLELHLLGHNNIKSFRCPENNCGKAYTNKSHLDRHIQNIHSFCENGMIYSCPSCMKRFANRQNLKRHLSANHNRKLPFTCDVCQLEFLKKHQLTAHMFQHTGIKSFSCEDCQKEFVSLNDKKKHARQHKTYNCTECSITFTQWSRYQKHIKFDHSGKEFICNECNRHFKQRSHMVRHVRTHLKTETKVFPCPYADCERVYSRNSNLRQHINIKHKKITHECKICGAELCTKAKLTQHLKRHSQPPTEARPVKTKLMGRKVRKDAGSFKMSLAHKLAGLEYRPKMEKMIDVTMNSH